MSTRCVTCGESFVCKCDGAAQNAVESAQHSLQQLKAKIRALVTEFCDIYDGGLSNEAVSLLLTKMRELSAGLTLEASSEKS